MLTEAQIEEIVDRALVEDLGWGDATTETLIPGDQEGIASIMAKEEGILAGIDIANKVFQRADPALRVAILIADGSQINPGSTIAKVEGNVASILKAERVALNFLQRLSGIASETNRYVKAVEGLSVRIMDTRKTTPSLRSMEKYAVSVGGGQNHRMNLGDGILIKDNHLAALRSRGLKERSDEAISKQGNLELKLRSRPRKKLRKLLKPGQISLCLTICLWKTCAGQ